MRRTRSSWLGPAFFAIALAVPSGVVFAFSKAFPDEKLEPRPGAGWLDTVFANQYVVCAARVVLISVAAVVVLGAVFVAVSIVYRMYRREFVHKLGWVEVSVAATADEDIEEAGESYRGVFADLLKRNQEIESRLERAAVVLAETTRERDRLREQCIRLGAASPDDT